MSMRAHDRPTEARLIAGILHSQDPKMLAAVFKRYKIFESANQQHLRKIREIKAQGSMPTVDSYLDRGDVPADASTVLGALDGYASWPDFLQDLAVLDSYKPATAIVAAMQAVQTIVSQNDRWDTVKPKDVAKVAASLKEALEPIEVGQVLELSSSAAPGAQRAARRAMESDRVRKWRTGWTIFDEATRGGLPSGTVLGLSSNTGGYKTSAAISASVSMWQDGARLDYVSMEMDQDLLLQRVLSRALNLEYDKIIGGELDHKDHPDAAREVQRLWKACLQSSTGTFRIHDSSAMGSQTIDNVLTIIESGETDVMVIDHLALFDAAEGQEDQMRLLINDNAKRIHKAALRHGIAVILLVQGTDELGHRESRSLNTHIDWDLRWVLGATERKYGLIDPQINKWRTGRPPEVLPMDVDFGRNRLTSISDDNPRYIAYKLEKAEKKEKKEKKWER